ncbi:interleukin 17 receptor E, isoform CRA_c [Mus musculus]|nr:interleukin 17 receptor E, isoform CRA_c [Mus musculus]
MGSPRLAALLLSLPLLLIGLAVSARVACPCLRSWTSHCLLAYRVVRSCCQSSFEPFPVEVWIRDS